MTGIFRIDIKRRVYPALIIFALISHLTAQEKPITITLLGTVQSQLEQSQASRIAGPGLGAQMSVRLLPQVDFKLQVNYDYQFMTQGDVLDRWKWDYWEKTYIDFLPGTDATIVNKTLTYTSTDSIYSATFKPVQRLKELRLSAGLKYRLPIVKWLQVYSALDFGSSIFFRELQMHEKWIKRYRIDSLATTKFDYEYRYDLLHFAPARKGTILFGAPSLGVKIYLTSALDLDLSAQYLYYFHRKTLWGIKLSDTAYTWFPMKSKMVFSMGVVFKY